MYSCNKERTYKTANQCCQVPALFPASFILKNCFCWRKKGTWTKRIGTKRIRTKRIGPKRIGDKTYTPPLSYSYSTYY
jgi:hypothetical protein